MPEGTFVLPVKLMTNPIRSNLLKVAAPPQRSLMASVWSSSQRSCLVLIYSKYVMLYTLSFDVRLLSVLSLCAAYKTLELSCSHFSEREKNVWPSISCLSKQSELLRKKIVDVIGSECLTKDTAVSQKCQQNVSKIAQRHEYRLPSVAISRNWPVCQFSW